jgi:hypothetical protein
MNSAGYSSMSAFEYLCTCTAVAGFLWVFTLYHPTKYDIAQPIIQECPSLVIRHGVDGKMKTFTRVVDECSESLHVIKQQENT